VAEPGFNWYSLVAFLPLLFVLHAAARGRVSRRFVACIGGLCLLLFLPFSGLFGGRGYRGSCFVFLLDASGSALPAERALTARFLEEFASRGGRAGPHDRAVVMLYGEDAVLAAGPAPFRDIDPLRVLADSRRPRREGTDLQKALDAALAVIPRGLRPDITVIGDGTADRGECTVPGNVSCRYLEVRPRGNDAAVVSLACPAAAAPGEEVAVRVVVHVSRAAAAVVRLYDGVGGKVLNTAAGKLLPGLNRFGFTVSFAGRGRHVLAAEVDVPGDVCPENDLRACSLTVSEAGGGGILVVGDPVEGLAGKAEVVSPERFSRLDAEAIASYEAVVLNDVPAGKLSREAMRNLAAYVREKGGGLLVVGTHAVFGPGGYGGTGLESLLPLSSKPRLPDDSPKRVMIAVDKSGSMNEPLSSRGGRKIDAAKAAALQFILDKGGEKNMRIGLLFFSAGLEVVKRPGEKAPPALLKEKVKTLLPHGGTRIIPAVSKCIDILRAEKGAEEEEDKYIFVITDGITRERVSDADVRRIAAGIRKGKIQLFTLKIGPGPGGVLKRICTEAGGEYRQLREGENPVVTFMREAEERTSRFFADGPCRARVCSAAVMVGFGEPGGEIPCTGYIRTSLRKNAVLLLKNAENDDPLAALRYVGLGRTAALAGLRSPVAARLGSRMLAWVRGAPPGAGGAEVEISRSKGGVDVRLVTENTVPAGAAVVFRAVLPGKGVKAVRMVREEENVFRAFLPLPPSVREFPYAAWSGGRIVAEGRYHVPYGAEYDPLHRMRVGIGKSAPLSRFEPGRERGRVWILLFLLLFTAWEAVEWIRRRREG